MHTFLDARLDFLVAIRTDLAELLLPLIQILEGSLWMRYLLQPGVARRAAQFPMDRASEAFLVHLQDDTFSIFK